MEEWTPKPQEQGWLEPPRRRPPTAVGVATPPPPRPPWRSAYRRTRMQQVGSLFAQLAFATALGLTAGTWLPLPILVSLLVGLTGGHVVLKRRRTRLARLVLHYASMGSRRAA